MPVAPYIISGTVKKGPREGYVEVNTSINTAIGSETVNLFIDSATSLAGSQTVYIFNVTTDETATATSNALGQYSYDVANMTTAYTNGDVIRIYSDTISATRKVTDTDSTAIIVPQAHGRVARTIAPGRLGKEHTEAYPQSVNVINQIISFENPSSEYTYSGGLIATQTITVKGVQYRKTYTANAGTIIAETAWIEV